MRIQNNSAERLVPLLTTLPALVFICAAWQKAFSPYALVYELSNFNLRLPLDGELALVVLLPALELGLGFALLFTRARWANAAALLLLAALTGAIVLGLPQGYLRHCGCLGAEDLTPGFSIIKNFALITLLIWDLFLKRSGGVFANPWGALALAVGGCWSGDWGAFLLYALVAGCAARSGFRSLLLAVSGLLIGLGLNLIQFPLLLLPLLAALYALARLQPVTRSLWRGVLLSIGLAGAAMVGLLLPKPPPPAVSVNVGEALTTTIVDALPAAALQEPTLLIFMDFECYDCRAWWGEVRGLTRTEGLPRLLGAAPQTDEEIVAQRRLIGFSFPIYSLSASDFRRIAPHTPLVLLAQQNRVVAAFATGCVPSSVEIISALQHASSAR